MDVDSFRKWIAKEQFLEYAEYVGNFYGTPKRYVDEAMEQGKDVILDIEVQGAIQVTSKRPDAVRIFIAPPSWAELERRLTERGTDSPDKVQKRLLRAKVEFQTAHTYDYFVITALYVHHSDVSPYVLPDIHKNDNTMICANQQVLCLRPSYRPLRRRRRRRICGCLHASGTARPCSAAHKTRPAGTATCRRGGRTPRCP